MKPCRLPVCDHQGPLGGRRPAVCPRVSYWNTWPPLRPSQRAFHTQASRLEGTQALVAVEWNGGLEGLAQGEAGWGWFLHGRKRLEWVVLLLLFVLLLVAACETWSGCIWGVFVICVGVRYCMRKPLIWEHLGCLFCAVVGSCMVSHWLGSVWSGVLCCRVFLPRLVEVAWGYKKKKKKEKKKTNAQHHKRTRYHVQTTLEASIALAHIPQSTSHTHSRHTPGKLLRQ